MREKGIPTSVPDNPRKHWVFRGLSFAFLRIIYHTFFFQKHRHPLFGRLKAALFLCPNHAIESQFHTFSHILSITAWTNMAFSGHNEHALFSRSQQSQTSFLVAIAPRKIYFLKLADFIKNRLFFLPITHERGLSTLAHLDNLIANSGNSIMILDYRFMLW